MNDAHLHLLVNHLPIVGGIFTVVLFGAALVVSSQRRGIFSSAVLLAVMSGGGAVMADRTGEGAEEMVEDLPDVQERLIHEHEERAETAVVLSVLAALTSVGMLALHWRREQIPAWAVAGSGVLALASAGAMAWTGQSGGLIRHTEIRDGAVSAEGPEEEEQGEAGERGH